VSSLTDVELNELRARAQDLARTSNWADLFELAPALRADVRYWLLMWAPAVALAARHLGDPTARTYLDEAVAGGFGQPELFEGELELQFGADPDWAALEAAMAANVPPARLELLEWPELSLALPVNLHEIAPDRRGALRERLPQPQSSAWATATALLGWVSTRWDHNGSAHVEWPDAVHVLDRVAGGERFACVEYSIVLSQALNACGIPARSVTLFRRNHHTGMGRAHAVTEAWIDDLGQWVLLDGQNGVYWVDGAPLGLVELRRRQRGGEPPAELVSLAGKASATPAEWWPYFHTVSPTGLMIAPGPYTPITEGGVQPCDELRRDPAGAHPDLLELAVGVVEFDGRAALQFATRHPHVRGFEVVLGEQTWPVPVGGAWTVPDTAAERTARVGTVTDFGPHGHHTLRFTVRTP
jgi:hypothetical protein